MFDGKFDVSLLIITIKVEICEVCGGKVLVNMHRMELDWYVRAICICALWIDYGHTSVTRLNAQLIE